MSFSRYQNDTTVNRGKTKKTARAVPAIRAAMRAGRIPCTIVTVKAGQRLDKIAAQQFGDGRLWWVIAACSNIGWALQVPPGTVLKIPISIAAIRDLI